MSRPRKIDRERALDVANDIVSDSGIAALSFGAVAAAAGVPKASVQSAFITRQALIGAMLDRWLEQEENAFERAAGANPTRRERVRAHIDTTADGSSETNDRLASLLAALASSGDQVGSAIRWYATRVGDLSASTEDDKRLRIAFLAAEGAFFMRHLVGFRMDDTLWREIFGDLQAFVEDPA